MFLRRDLRHRADYFANPSVEANDLFQDSDPPPGIPAMIEQEVFGLLVQLVQSMIPIVQAEAADEQDLH